MTEYKSPIRTVYLKKTPHGYLGQRRFSHKEGTTHPKDTSFDHARIFTRKQDAEQYEGELVEAVLVVLEP